MFGNREQLELITHHAVGNVRAVPTAFNFAKYTQLDEVALLHLLAFLEHQNGRESRRLAPVLLMLAELNRGSATARVLSTERKEAYLNRLQNFRNWLNGESNVTPAPSFGLPEPDVQEAIDGYKAGRPDPDLLQSICEQLCDEPVNTHPHLLLNEDQVCTLFFDSSTTTEDIARFLLAVITRMRYQCGAAHPWVEIEDEELKLYRFYLRIMVTQGYTRRQGLIGLVDPATNLPMVVGAGPHHPLAASLAAHAEHGSPLSISPPNINVESWFWNRFRRSYRAGSLLGVVNELLPTLQALRNKLTDRNLFNNVITLAPATYTPRFHMLYGRNYIHPLEHAYMDAGRAARLRQQLDAYVCTSTANNQSAYACRCANCNSKIRLVVRAESAHRIVYG